MWRTYLYSVALFLFVVSWILVWIVMTVLLIERRDQPRPGAVGTAVELGCEGRASEQVQACACPHRSCGKPPRRRPQANDNKTPSSLKTNVLSGNKSRHTHRLVISHGCGAGSRNRRSAESCQTPSTRSRWRRPGSSRRSCGETEPIIQEKINQETEHNKVPRNQYTDKVVNVTVVIQEQVSPDSSDAQRVGEGNPTSEFGLDLRYSERAC